MWQKRGPQWCGPQSAFGEGSGGLKRSGGVHLRCFGRANQPGVCRGLKSETVDLLFESDGGGAERFDSGGGSGHFSEIFVAERMDGVEACA